MILPDYLLPEVIKFCQAKNIPINNGNVPKIYAGEINDFINHQLKLDREKTKAREEMNNASVGMQIKNIMAGLRVESPIEECLLNALTVEGLAPYLKTQFQIGTKRVDFAFPIARLVVEADGVEYHRANKGQLEADQKRDVYLARRGWRVLHIEGLAIRRNIKLCIDRIKQELDGYLDKVAQEK